jgi:hypothetical protein
LTKDEALKLALEALCDIVEGSRLDAAGNRNDDGLLDHNGHHDYTKRVKAAQYAIASGKEALAQPPLPVQPVQEPVAWAVYDKRGGSKSLHWPDQHSSDGDATVFDAVPLVPQRPWQGLTPEEMKHLYPYGRSVWGKETYEAIEKALKEKNT